MPIQISDAYERSSANVAGSSVSGAGDAAIITLSPRAHGSEVTSGEPRWLEVSARLTGVLGTRPTIRVSGYAPSPTYGTYHGAPWQSTRRGMFSYDGRVWQYMSDTSVVGSRIEMRHSAPFTSDTVYIARGRQMSVQACGEWLDGVAAAHPTRFGPTASAVAFVAGPALAGYAGQAFIAGEFSPQTDERGRAIPATPLYCAQINDLSVMPASGSKWVAILASGVHSGEDHANHVLAGMVNALLANTPDAIALRRDFRILVVPMVNAPGRAGGGWRGSFTKGNAGADDANRHFVEDGSGLQIVDRVKAAIGVDLGLQPLAWGIDIHGTYLGPWAIFQDQSAPMTSELPTCFSSALR